jgi:hypothetical protein
MKKYLLAIAVTSGSVFGLSAQAAPVTTQFSTLQSQVAPDGAAQKVWHCRRWSGGWGCGYGPLGVLPLGPRWGYHGRHRSHWRWGSSR